MTFLGGLQEVVEEDFPFCCLGPFQQCEPWSCYSSSCLKEERLIMTSEYLLFACDHGEARVERTLSNIDGIGFLAPSEQCCYITYDNLDT